MKLGVFVNQYEKVNETLDRITADDLGIILVQNGIYNAVLKEGGTASPVLAKKAKYYALSEDVVSRGFKTTSVDSKVKVIDYDGLVDLIFNDYEKLIWL